jgi:hypothetical protein
VTAPQQPAPVATAVLRGVTAELVHVAMTSTTSATRRDGLSVRARETSVRVQAALAASGYTTAGLRMPATAADANPCPCGWFGAAVRECSCPAASRQRHTQRLAPIADRCDIVVAVPSVSLSDLRDAPRGESSATVQARVVAARAIQAARGQLNATLPEAALRLACPGHDAVPTRTLRVARTIADLQGADAVTADHVTRAAALTSGAAALAEAAS